MIMEQPVSISVCSLAIHINDIVYAYLQLNIKHIYHKCLSDSLAPAAINDIHFA